MRKLIALAVIIAGPCLTFAAPPSDASIRELLKVMDVRKTVETEFAQMDEMIKTGMGGQGGRTLSPSQQKAADKAIETLKAEFTWEKLEPVYLDVYRKRFSQEEIDGMLAFYKTPVGASVIKKMADVEADTAAAIEEKTSGLMEKLMSATLAGALQDAATEEKKTEPASLEQRIGALEDYIAAGDTTVGPELTKRALAELSRRVPTAVEPEARFRRADTSRAIVSIAYTLPDKTAHQQDIQFAQANGTWNLTWIPEAKEEKSGAPAGTK